MSVPAFADIAKAANDVCTIESKLQGSSPVRWGAARKEGEGPRSAAFP